MPGPRQPTDLIKANGRKHLSEAEEAERRSREVSVPPARTARPPKWLPETLKKDFRALGKQLIATGEAEKALTACEPDPDRLGAVRRTPDQAQAEAWGRVQERYFKQARNCANDMGLTVSSRCRLVIPGSVRERQRTEDDNPFLRLIQGGRAREA